MLAYSSQYSASRPWLDSTALSQSLWHSDISLMWNACHFQQKNHLKEFLTLVIFPFGSFAVIAFLNVFQ